MKYEQNLTSYKSILLPQPYRALIGLDDNLNMQPSNINPI